MEVVSRTSASTQPSTAADIANKWDTTCQINTSGRDKTKTLQVHKNYGSNANFGAPKPKYGRSDDANFTKTKCDDTSLKMTTTAVIKHTPSPCWAIIKGENSLGERVSKFLTKEINENWSHRAEIVGASPNPKTLYGLPIGPPIPCPISSQSKSRYLPQTLIHPVGVTQPKSPTPIPLPQNPLSQIPLPLVPTPHIPVCPDCEPLGLEEWSDEHKTQWLHTRNTIPTAYSITYPSPDDRRKQLLDIMKTMDEAEGLILVTGEFNLRLPATVTLLFESLPQSVYFGKPCAVVCYSPGVSSGRRAGIQARAFLGEMSCLTIGTILALPQVHLTIDTDGNCEKEEVKHQLTSFLHHLTWYSSALSSYRKKSPFPNKFYNTINDN